MFQFFKRTHERRKGWKAAALLRVRKHYWMGVLICLLLALLDIGYSGSTALIQTNFQKLEDSAAGRVYGRLTDSSDQLTASEESADVGSEESAAAVSEEEAKEQKKEQRDHYIGFIALEHSSGVAADLVNMVSSGAILEMVFDAVYSITESPSVSRILVIILSFAVLLLIQIFFFNVISVIGKRYFLEARIYDVVPTRRFLYLIRTGRWINTAKTIFVTDVRMILWSLTIIGGPIKAFSYMLVPYIAAENPGISAKDAIRLSRRMMNGHKFEAFCLTISYIPWMIVGWFTAGLAEILFVNPYREAVTCEFYANLRKEAIENKIEGADLLSDRYLYELADVQVIRNKYEDIVIMLDDLEYREAKEPEVKKTFLRKWFGIVLRYGQDELNYEKHRANEDRLAEFELILERKAYPVRLRTLHEKQRVRELKSVHYHRNYSVTSLILMFFIMSMTGWIWEAALHIVQTGEFVNRGILHGPWIPIYGSGGLLILLVLKRLRKNPAIEFLAAVVLCGLLEYMSGWYLEITHNGQKWWDYSGYFLNIHGRVCAEGLLAFGLGGLAFVYLLAPFFDNVIRRIPLKIAISCCVVLVAGFAADLGYSHFYPNAGPGVSSSNPIVESTADTAAEAAAGG